MTPETTDVADGLFAPKPLRRDLKLGLELINLEVPECPCRPDCICQQGREGYPKKGKCPGLSKCKFCPRRTCHHVYGVDKEDFPETREDLWEVILAYEFPFSLERWATLLAAYDPVGYADPPPPREPTTMVTREARAAVLKDRAANGEGFYHPLDVLAADGQFEHLHVEGRLGKTQGGLKATWHEEDDEIGAGLDLDLERKGRGTAGLDAVSLRSLEFDRAVARAIEANARSAGKSPDRVPGTNEPPAQE